MRMHAYMHEATLHYSEHSCEVIVLATLNRYMQVTNTLNY